MGPSWEFPLELLKKRLTTHLPYRLEQGITLQIKDALIYPVTCLFD